MSQKGKLDYRGRRTQVSGRLDRSNLNSHVLARHVPCRSRTSGTGLEARGLGSGREIVASAGNMQGVWHEATKGSQFMDDKAEAN